MPTPQTLRAELNDRLPRMLADIAELVGIDSGSYDAEGVTRVVHWIGDRLQGLGFTPTYEDVEERGQRLFATRRFGGTGRLMILGHADTVWPKGTAREWPYAVKGERATGPGVGDMKGGLVMAIHALDVAIAAGSTGFEEIKYVVVCDEELGSPKCRGWIEDHARAADWVLVLEPARPGGGMMTSRGAVGAFFVEAKGTSAHAAVNYHKGASAVRELAAMVGPLEALSDPDAGLVVNVGRFEGGQARQVIPHEARLHMDVRARTPDQATTLEAEIRRIVETRRDPRVEVALLGGWTRPSWPPSEGTARLFAIAERIARELDVPNFEMPTVAGGSDGSFCGALGVATLDGTGPECADICSRDETILLRSVADRGAIFAGLIAELSRH